MRTLPKLLHKSLMGLALLAMQIVCAPSDAAAPPNLPLVDFKFQLEVPKGSSEATFVISAKIPMSPVTLAPYHLFSTRNDKVNGDRATRITFDKDSPWEPLGEGYVADRAPHAAVEDGDPVEQFERQVTWKRKFRLKPSAGPIEQAKLSGVLKYQICDTNSCRTPKVDFHVPVTIVEQLAQALPAGEPGDPPLIVPGADKVDANLPTSEPEPIPAAATRDAAALPTDHAKAGEPGTDLVKAPPAAAGAAIDKSKGLWVFLLTAVAAGFGALLTPCVFPMIPITISFFNKQAEKEHHRPISMATVYCVGIIATFTLLGMLMSIAFGAASLNQFANRTGFNIFLAGVLLFFGFSLLGMYEIRMPSWLLTATSGQQSRGGYLGVLFMALTFTLTSFTCTFAFAGGLLVAAAQGDRLWPVMGLLAFSSAFALPFFFLALFPSLLQRMPKSGGWMNVIKVIMGMIEIGAAFKFLSNADFKLNTTPWLFDFEVVVSAWMVISITTGAYLLGLFRLPHDSESSHVGTGRLLIAMSFLGLAAYLAIGLFAPRPPSGKLWDNIQSMAPPRFENVDEAPKTATHFAHQQQDVRPDGPVLKHGDLFYSLDVKKALELAVRENRPLLVEFTGVNCANCRKMEKGPMTRPEVKDRLQRFVRVQLYTDLIPPTKTLTDEQQEQMLELNIKLQADWFKDASMPAYGIVPPDPAILENPNAFLNKHIGMELAKGEFAQFLDVGLNKWKTIQAQKEKEHPVGRNESAKGSLVGSRN